MKGKKRILHEGKFKSSGIREFIPYKLVHKSSGFAVSSGFAANEDHVTMSPKITPYDEIERTAASAYAKILEQMNGRAECERDVEKKQTLIRTTLEKLQATYRQEHELGQAVNIGQRVLELPHEYYNYISCSNAVNDQLSNNVKKDINGSDSSTKSNKREMKKIDSCMVEKLYASAVKLSRVKSFIGRGRLSDPECRRRMKSGPMISDKDAASVTTLEKETCCVRLSRLKPPPERAADRSDVFVNKRQTDLPTSTQSFTDRQLPYAETLDKSELKLNLNELETECDESDDVNYYQRKYVNRRLIDDGGNSDDVALNVSNNRKYSSDQSMISSPGENAKDVRQPSSYSSQKKALRRCEEDDYSQSSPESNNPPRLARPKPVYFFHGRSKIPRYRKEKRKSPQTYSHSPLLSSRYESSKKSAESCCYLEQDEDIEESQGDVLGADVVNSSQAHLQLSAPAVRQNSEVQHSERLIHSDLPIHRDRPEHSDRPVHRERPVYSDRSERSPVHSAQLVHSRENRESLQHVDACLPGE